VDTTGPDIKILREGPIQKAEIYHLIDKDVQ
jgi:tRNA A37 threonylcarbamoyladenosine synthetase subunit TsaC/SUA5/YrdC